MPNGGGPRYDRLAKGVDIFNGLSPEDVEKIFIHGITMNVQKGQPVFEKGTVGNQMFVVLGGSFGVFDGVKQLATLRTGDTFGEMSLLLSEPRSATVKALELGHIFVLDERVFQKLLTKRVAVQMLMNISRMLARRLNAANRTIREMEGR
jgi:CRP-like cAMP-binding protein